MSPEPHLTPAAAVVLVGRGRRAGSCPIVERDGSARLETDGSCHLDDGEKLLTPPFVVSVPADEGGTGLATIGFDDEAEDGRVGDALDDALRLPTGRL